MAASRHNTLVWFRNIAIAEGTSFVVLLFIAMPLKYWANLPEAVKIVGWAHGLLFVIFLLLAVAAKVQLRKPFVWLIKAFAASVLPLGTFLLEKQMRKEGDFD